MLQFFFLLLPFFLVVCSLLFLIRILSFSALFSFYPSSHALFVLKLAVGTWECCRTKCRSRLSQWGILRPLLSQIVVVSITSLHVLEAPQSLLPCCRSKDGDQQSMQWHDLIWTERAWKDNASNDEVLTHTNAAEIRHRKNFWRSFKIWFS